MKYVVALDIGGTNVRSAIVSETGQILFKDSVRTILHDKEGLINQIQMMIGIAIRQCEKPISGIGIGIPGPVNPETGYVHDLPNIGVSNIDLRPILEARFGLPVVLINDANAAGYAEAMIGAGKGYKTVQYITLSTGIGGGLVIDGQLITGTRGFAQEIGNMVIDPNRPSPNPSMNQGSFESWCSGKSLVLMAKERGVECNIAGEVFINDKLTGLFDEWLRHLGMALGNIINLYEPDIIVLGGGIMKSSQYFMDKLEECVSPFIYKALRNLIPIAKAINDQDAGLIGAGLYCLYRIN